MKPLSRQTFRPSDIFAEKFKAIVAAKGCTQRAAAKQLGLSNSLFCMIYYGRLIPDPNIAARIVLWATQNVDFSVAPTLIPDIAKPFLGAKNVDKRWHRETVRLPRDTTQRLTIMAKKYHMSIGTLIQIAIERLLDNEPIIATLEEAGKRWAKATLTQAFMENPFLMKMMDLDLELVSLVAKGKKMPATAEVIKNAPTSVEQIERARVVDGVASPAATEPLDVYRALRRS